MKIGVLIPVLTDVDVETIYKNVAKACSDSKINFEIIFALNAKLNGIFTKIKKTYADNAKVKAFFVDRVVDEHKLIALGLQSCEAYDATIVYSAKEMVNIDVIKAFITSWQAGNKIVYLRKVYTGFKKVVVSIKNMFYKMGTSILGLYKDMLCETDIQLFDNDVVLTLNQLPAKSRQLRTLNAFVGYTTDIIHIEVDPKEPVNSSYNKKSKEYHRNLLACLGASIISVGAFAVNVISMCLSWPVPFWAYVLMWFGFLLSLIFAIIFGTRKTLIFRAGTPVELSEINVLKEKMEYYNMQILGAKVRKKTSTKKK